MLLESLNTLSQIDVVFANPGTSEMHLVSALDRLPIRPILCLHETVASGACDGYSRMVKRPALAILHLGPGLANGLSNLHNARRSKSEIVVLVGEMASFHKAADPVLNMDVIKLASSVSRRVISIELDLNRSNEVSSGFVSNIIDSLDDDSRICTVLLPHDAAWGSGSRLPQLPLLDLFPSKKDPSKENLEGFCAALIKAVKGKIKIGIYCGGLALGSHMILDLIAKIAASLRSKSENAQVKLFCENSFSRIERGAGRPSFTRLPYFPDDAARELKKLDLLITVGVVKLPVANFGYESAVISELVTHLDLEHEVWEIDGSETSNIAALDLIANDLGAVSIKAGVNCRGYLSVPSRPSLSLDLSRPLDPSSLCRVLAALQPEDCIVVDESLTSGSSYFSLSEGCPPFSHLTLTGGAIGSGPPLALGASIASPSRLVIDLQADGSAMYSLQALWSQAREKCNVLTIICDNSSYQILKIEQVKQRLPAAGHAMKVLTSLTDPSLDWVSLARGMGVDAIKVRTVGEFKDQIEAVMSRWEKSTSREIGPFLIHASLI